MSNFLEVIPGVCISTRRIVSIEAQEHDGQWIVLIFTDIIGTLLLALAVYAGAFTVPILWGLLGLRAKPRFVAAAIVAGGALALAGKLCPALPGTLGAHTGDVLMVAAFAVNAIILAFGRVSK